MNDRSWEEVKLEAQEKVVTLDVLHDLLKIDLSKATLIERFRIEDRMRHNRRVRAAYKDIIKTCNENLE